MERIVFVNVTAGISDKSMFDIPAACSVVAVGPPVSTVYNKILLRQIITTDCDF